MPHKNDCDDEWKHPVVQRGCELCDGKYRSIVGGWVPLLSAVNKCSDKHRKTCAFSMPAGFFDNKNRCFIQEPAQTDDYRKKIHATS